MIIPVQFFRSMSSSFSRPQLAEVEVEVEAEVEVEVEGEVEVEVEGGHLMVPSPTPFWPASSSSSSLKLRGITGEGRQGSGVRVQGISGRIRKSWARQGL